MKKIIMWLCRKENTLVLFLFLSIPFFAKAQPTWPGGGPPAASMSDLGITLQTTDDASDVEHISSDLFFEHAHSTSSKHYILAIAWDERDASGNWNVWFEVRDNVYASTPFTPSNGFDLSGILGGDEVKNPDIVLLDQPSANANGVILAVVYENITDGTIELIGLEMNNFFDHGIPPSTPAYGGAYGPYILNSNPNNAAENPRIDAMPRYYNPGTSPWYTGQTYMPLLDIAVTWTEYDSGTPEIWIDHGTINGGVSGSPVKVASDATFSDVACILKDDTQPLAYVSYVDNSDDIQLSEYDISGVSPSFNSNTTVFNTSTQTIAKPPRLDATNVIQTGGPNWPYQHWGITAQITDTDEKIYYFGPGGTTNFHGSTPYSAGDDGYNPAIAVGPGPDAYVPVLATEFANTHYIQASSIDLSGTTDLYGTDCNISTGGFGNYAWINANTQSITPDIPLAVGTGSNCGIGHIAAWYNEVGGNYDVYYKVNTGTNLAFKPGKPSSVLRVDSHSYVLYPNPVKDKLNISGADGEDFAVMDITGRTLATGRLAGITAGVDVSFLAPGMYLLHIYKDGHTEQVKFVKQ